MPLIITAKERVDDTPTAFRQIERYTQRLETYLGVSMGLTGTQAITDVPIGAIVGSMMWPSTTTNIASNTTVITESIPVVFGHTYMVTLTVLQAQEITNAAASIVQVFGRDSLGIIPNSSTGLKALIVNSIPLNGFVAGSSSCVGPPTNTGADSFTVAVNTSTASLQFAANTVQLFVTRVA